MAITPNTTFSSGAVLTADEMNRLPWGVVGYKTTTTDQTGIGSSYTTITGMDITWTADSTRIYRLIAHLPLQQQNTAAGYIQGVITDGSNAIKQFATNTIDAGRNSSITLVLVEAGLSGSTTRRLRLATQGGTVDFLVDATYPATFVIEDIGRA